MKDDRKTATKKEMHNFDDLIEINIRVTMGGIVLRNVKVLPLVQMKLSKVPEQFLEYLWENLGEEMISEILKELKK